jgi:hypothetical protein
MILDRMVRSVMLLFSSEFSDTLFVPVALSTAVDLADLPELRSIEIHQPYDDWVFTLLSKIISPHIEEAVFSLFLEETATLDSLLSVVDCESLERVFELPQFSRIRNVQFIYADFSREMDDGKVREYLKSQMPQCNRRGIVTSRLWCF